MVATYISAMVGFVGGPSMWMDDDWRPIVGTSVDTRRVPVPLRAREEQLLLSTWWRHPTREFLWCQWLAKSQRDILRETKSDGPTPHTHPWTEV